MANSVEVAIRPGRALVPARTATLEVTTTSHTVSVREVPVHDVFYWLSPWQWIRKIREVGR